MDEKCIRVALDKIGNLETGHPIILYDISIYEFGHDMTGNVVIGPFKEILPHVRIIGITGISPSPHNIGPKLVKVKLSPLFFGPRKIIDGITIDMIQIGWVIGTSNTCKISPEYTAFDPKWLNYVYTYVKQLSYNT